MTAGADERSQPRPAQPGRSYVIAFWTVMTGLLTVGAGLAWIWVGIGYANATASGTGAAAVAAGAWTVLATRGVILRRRRTYAGLGLVWTWLFLRIGLDLPAIATGTAIMLFTAPAVCAPFGLAWAGSVAVGTLMVLVRAIGAMRSGPIEAADRTARGRLALGFAWRICLVMVLTALVPWLVRWSRGTQIARIAREYSGPAGRGAGSVVWGACSQLFLGYELTQHGESARTDQERRAAHGAALADAEADLASIVAAGARLVRVGASGDHLLVSNPDQEALDDRYMDSVRRTGIPLVLVDTQHPRVLRERKLDWPDFCAFQRRRIEYYQRRYRPRAYLVACEPMSYHKFALSRHAAFSEAAWTRQLATMCRLVRSIDPTTRTGICLLVSDDHEPEWQIWARMKELPELDLLSVQIYQPDQFSRTRERLRRHGHPRQVAKRLWIAETYNGWALTGDRLWEQDAAWLRATGDYAAAIDAEAVLVWTFGTFVPGGSFWDVGSGRLGRRWQAAPHPSLIGRTFSELAAAGAGDWSR
ncbi:MAG: hypothetical protein HY815_21385 [Candidatus Riflebacteria bacterium]|nr:hypothetical protein [Candidatus Riflebacteria bacterium]